MQKIKDNIWRIVIISLSGVILWGISRGFIFKKLIPLNDPPDVLAYGDSYFFLHGLFFPILAIIGIIVLTCYVIFFVLIEENLYGNKYFKGFIYGLSFFIMYMIAFFEFYHFFNGTFFQSILAGFADGTPLLLTGLLLGVFLGTDRNIKMFRPVKYLTSIIYIPIFFLIGRILFYNTIYLSPIISQFISILFILFYGISIGLSYFILTQGIKTKRNYKIPLYYTLIFLAISLSGNTLICIRYQFPFYQMIILSLIDAIAVIIGGLLTEFLNTKHRTVYNT